jgi:hypothetical protein
MANPFSQMKKIFALFCAVVLMPSFSAHAWIGGPFGNNSFFGNDGDDGVYEAAATGKNATGLYRIVVGNGFAGVNPTGLTTSVPGTTTGVTGTPVVTGGVSSGNVVIGAYGTSFNNVWYYEGIFYAGSTLGTASSVRGTVSAFADARDNRGTGTNHLVSRFVARFESGGDFIPARVFSGSGRAQLGLGAGPSFRFGVYGSKVANTITLGR